MNKRKILARINKIAHELDQNLFHKEADQLTKIMVKIASEFSDEDFKELLKKSREKPQPLESVDDSLSVHNPNVYRIKMLYHIIDTEIKETEIYLTEEKSVDKLIVNSIKFIKSKHNLKLSDNLQIHLELRAENPRSEREIWAGGYDYKQENGNVDLEEDRRGFPEDNYEAENINDAERFMDVAQRVMEQMKRGELQPKPDPVQQAINEKMLSFPGSEYDRAYDTALDEIDSTFTFEDKKPTPEQITAKAKEVAEAYVKNPNRNRAYLMSLIDDAVYDLM